jgi:NAD/NADP transhydrogenase beta subunit
MAAREESYSLKQLMIRLRCARSIGAVLFMGSIAAAVCMNLAVDALHFVTGPDCRDPFRHFVNSYLIAATLPWGAYFLLPLNNKAFRFLGRGSS